MSPSHVLAPTYAAIKGHLMAGDWPGGMRLEAARVADQLGVSITPVRDSLYRLVGERMVDFVPGEGFHAHALSEIEYRDMLELNLSLLLAAQAIGSGSASAEISAKGDYFDRVAQIFLGLGQRSGNSELAAVIAALNDRLHLARRHDAVIFADVGSEGAAIEVAAGESGMNGALRRLLMRYHERRAGEASALVRLLKAASE